MHRHSESILARLPLLAFPSCGNLRLPLCVCPWLGYLLRSAVPLAMACAALCGNACGHSMNVFAVVEGQTIQGEVFARGGTPFSGVTVVAYAADGRTLGETRTDDSGKFSLVPTERCDWRLVASTDDGHQAEYTVPADELPQGLPLSASQPPAPPQPPRPGPSAPAHSVESQAPDAAATAPGLAGLEHQLTALRREVNDLRAELRWQDILGGLGYILGLMGLAFYFLGVEKRSRNPARSCNNTPPAAPAETVQSQSPAKIDT